MRNSALLVFALPAFALLASLLACPLYDIIRIVFELFENASLS